MNKCNYKFCCFLILLFSFPLIAWPFSDSPAYLSYTFLKDVKQPALSLNGTWDFRYSPKDRWEKVEVPGELAMQGYAIEHDTPYLYRKSFTLPADYKGKRTILRFDGVYSYARLKVNGTFIRDHHGGFTRWETDITDWVIPGKKNEIEVEVTDRIDDISYASGYAHHPIGGILRDVTILAQPPSPLIDFYVEAELDSLYQDTDLKIGYEILSYSENKTAISFELTDPMGKPVSLNKLYGLSGNNQQGSQQMFSVKNPLKWNAEHPHLYTLTVRMLEGEQEIAQFSQMIGFRKIEVIKEKLMVNGMPVKLRGACRHDIHPTLGRTTTAELDSLDVLLFKQSNMNFVRTSHYPPSETFVRYCDQMGIYVECETAVCFVDTYRQKNYAPGASQNDPEFLERYLSQCAEMVKTFRSNPSVIIWSIGNESVYGSNFQASWDWVKGNDPTRPVIFSYPGSVDREAKIYDLLSMHYQDVNGNVNQWGMQTRGYQGHGIPALFDEWAHPACYTYATLQKDPNIREFWGISLDKMWSGLFDAPGGLGGAIWGYIDETFMLPVPRKGTAFWKEFARTAKPEDYQGKCVGYGEWGIADVWRRTKPEFWSTKKAYSPIRILSTQIHSFIPGEKLILPVHNRFDHTNLNEITVRYNYQGKAKECRMSSVDPHRKGVFHIPAENWLQGTELFIEFISASNGIIDSYLVTLGDKEILFPSFKYKGQLTVEETPEQLIIKGHNFVIPFDKQTGLIHNAVSEGQVIIENGPFLYLDINLNHLTGAEIRKRADKYIVNAADWQKESFSYKEDRESVVVYLSGSYKDIHTEITLFITPQGRMDINYLTHGEPNGYLREAGLLFHLPSFYQHLEWKRKGYWDYYPNDDFAGNEGNTSLYQSKQAAYGMKPVQPWSYDTHNYFYWADVGANSRQPLTQIAKGMKENIFYYTLSGNQDKHRLSVISPDASLGCRIYKQSDEQLELYINNRWDYPEIAWGNYCKTLEVTPCFGTISIIF